MKLKISFLAVFLLAVHLGFCDYLTVSRVSNIKADPTKDGVIIEKVEKGTFLVLLDDGTQENGYYHVVAPTTQRDGWIYRNRVRRKTGSIPGLTAPDTTDIVWKSNIPDGYYAGTDGLAGQELKTALYNIIKDHIEFVYTSSDVDVWDILKETDRAPNNPERVRLFYTDRTRDAALEYDQGRGWTREHVWAKSHGDFGTSLGAGTDVHHLRPVDASVNSTRSNKDFDNGGIEYIDGDFATGCLRDEDSWEPKDAEKGDVARMLFYMAVRYEGESGEPDLEVVDEVDTAPRPVHGKLSALIQWHKQDSVSNWERRRNDIIYTDFQRNRNPFIDHPEFVELIWGN